MPLRIAIDARHVRDFGVGTYIRNLMQALGKLDSENQYILVAHKSDSGLLTGLPANFTLTWLEGRDTEFSDHFSFPLFLHSLHADLFHIPITIVPFFMPRPYVVTVHDVSRLMFDYPEGWRYDLRRYRFRRGLMRADTIIAVSLATKTDVEGLLDIPAERIRLIYNAPDPRFFEHEPPADARAAGPEILTLERRRILERYQITCPFLLYAGTIRPQKNIPRLVKPSPFSAANSNLILFIRTSVSSSSATKSRATRACAARSSRPVWPTPYGFSALSPSTPCACFTKQPPFSSSPLCTKDSAFRLLKPWPAEPRSSHPTSVRCLKSSATPPWS